MKAWNLTVLTAASLLTMGLWFSGSAVLPQLVAEWGLGSTARSWMTLAVQLGFVAGALLSALLTLSDRIPLHRLFLVCALGASGATAAMAFVHGPGPALWMRFLTGFFLAGVYPPGMKLVASWCLEDRGFGIGFLVGAITVGSALPHLLNALPWFGEGGMPPWRPTLLAAAGLGAGGGILGGVFCRTGPYLGQTAPFDWRYVGRAFRSVPVRLANFGYLGHMWELYAMWTWVPLFLLASYKQAGWSATGARVAGFGAVAAGGAGSLLAGLLADRVGRTAITSWSLVISGSCCVLAGFLFDSPLALTVLCLVWGFAVVADSAQFSSAVSELSDPRYVGTTLTLQVSMGFLLTVVTIWLVPVLLDAMGWRYVFLVLVPGPVFGVWSMLRLRARPEAVRMAGGHR